MSTESLFNKMKDYLYDPVTKTVLRESVKNYAATPPHPDFFYVRDAVWAVTSSLSDSQEADIQVIDPVSGSDEFDEVMNLHAFTARFPELAAGIAELTVQAEPPEPVRFDITTKDGRNVYYYLEEDKVFADIADYA